MPPHAHDHSSPHVSGHSHSHAPAVDGGSRRAAPATSLLRMSLGRRLSIAAGFIALIWIAVYWALH